MPSPETTEWARNRPKDAGHYGSPAYPKVKNIDKLPGPTRELVELGHTLPNARMELQPKTRPELETEIASLDREIYTLNRRRKQAIQELDALPTES
jgi:hypothetical protein